MSHAAGNPPWKGKNEVGVAIWGNVYTPPVLALPRTENLWGTELGLHLPLLPLPPLFTFRSGALPLRLHLDPTVAVQHAALGLYA